MVLDRVLHVEALKKEVSSVESDEAPITIIDHLSCSIEAGESVAIMGASGSGKSTLLSLMAGLDRPTSGEVFMMGHALSPLDEEAKAALRLQYVGFIFQSFHLIPTLTALQNVSVPLYLSNNKTNSNNTRHIRHTRQGQNRAPIGQKAIEAKATELLERLGLKGRLHHLPKQLSGGEQQRVAIARALISEPAILFADEPTGNLDRKNSDQVCQLLFDMVISPALVLVTHDPKVAQRCQKVLFLEEGRLIEGEAR